MNLKIAFLFLFDKIYVVMLKINRLQTIFIKLPNLSSSKLLLINRQFFYFCHFKK
jgi:hypothetical protein